MVAVKLENENENHLLAKFTKYFISPWKCSKNSWILIVSVGRLPQSVFVLWLMHIGDRGILLLCWGTLDLGESLFLLSLNWCRCRCKCFREMYCLQFWMLIVIVSGYCGVFSIQALFISCKVFLVVGSLCHSTKIMWYLITCVLLTVIDIIYN